MGITIRSEQIKDYHEIAEVHALAFTYSQSMGEVPLVDVHRHGKQYDPKLSLVAELDGKVIGHVLFSPHEIRIKGKRARGILLSPIAIHPDFQQRGIGGQLIEEGHRRAKERGYTFSMLLGHPEYYSKFGYKSKMFGTCYSEVQIADIQNLSEPEGITERRIKTEDITGLQSMWDHWFKEVGLAFYPGDSILNWNSLNKGITSSALEFNNELIGYIRYDRYHPEKVLSFLAKDRPAAQKTLALLASKVREKDMTCIQIPVHPETQVTKEFLGVPYQGKVQTWEAGMIHILDEQDMAIKSYCEEALRDERKAGNIIWPVEFDVC